MNKAQNKHKSFLFKNKVFFRFFRNISFTSRILLGCCLVSLYILTTSVFPSIKIPYSFLSPEATEAFNRIAESLASSLLLGVFIFFITISLTNMRNRRKRIWEIYDLYIKLGVAKADVEKELGVKSEYFDIVNFKEYYSQTINDMFKNKLINTLDILRLYESLLSEQENNLIAEIRKYLIVETPNNLTTETDIINSLEMLKNICRNINKLNNIIIEDIP